MNNIKSKQLVEVTVGLSMGLPVTPNQPLDSKALSKAAEVLDSKLGQAYSQKLGQSARATQENENKNTPRPK